MIRLLNAERIKLGTLRSTWWSTGSVVVVSVAVAMLIASAVGVNDGPTDTQETIAILVIAAAQLAHIAVMSVAIIVATSEYRFGQIRMTLAASPKRWQVMIAKAVVSVVTALIVGTITIWLIVLLCKPLLPDNWALDLGADQAMRAIWGIPLFFAASALFAFSIGVLVRSSPAAIVIVAVLSLAVEKTLLAIPKTRDVAQYLPFNAGARITQPTDAGLELSPWGGFGLFCLYAVILFVVATVLTETRDA